MPTDAQSHAAARQAVVTAAAGVAAQQWAKVDPNNIAQSWDAGSARLAIGVSGAQLAVAQQADPYIQASLVAEGTPAPVTYAVAAAALAGVSADGRPMASLLYEPAITVLVGIKGGASVDRSMAVGLSQLDTIVRTEVADAGRAADQISMTTHNVEGYVRHVVGATCNRCLILAGRWYRYSAGFERHPNCDCVMIPASREAETLSPDAIYHAMTPEQRSKAGWSQDEQKAIGLGADIASVTNIHRKGSLYVAGGRQFTREAAGRRPRITPRQIFREVPNDRDEQIRLLRLHRYIR